MNSYPPELLAQLAPVMFVGGLDAPLPTSASAPPTPQSPVQSPAAFNSTPSAKSADAFATLALRLRDALLAQRKVAIWQPERSKSFQVILVDKDVRFPPRKLLPQDDAQYAVAHSPLSPLTPSSPLYPDGLIAPIWVRKHTTLVPSVFVLFLRIFEYPAITPRSPLDAPDPDREREREQEERKRDAELAAGIALRKKSTNEWGIKLTVVLMASRRMLDDPSLDARLTYIRRQSGLDSKAALFVLSPVSPAELGDFVRSLQQALYEPAVEYYTNHSKRVRRKRNKHSQSNPTYANPVSPLGSAGIARPLRPEGWTVRYEYKMACFAEFRGENEVALKHYQDAYAMLVIMFGSTAILPPRTKRWAEAKVLADCISVKVSKLYLYNNEHALALSQHNAHMRKFGDFSRGWGIGEETYEYWSWMARQHRVLAELLEQGTRSTLVIPTHLPAQPPAALTAALAASQVQAPARGAAIEADMRRSLGLNPSNALQHPGFYYYMAAQCTEMRRARFLAAVEAEFGQPGVAASPGFANEKKVDHLVIILELYTKAYELFKKYAPVNSHGQSQGRLTLWIAYRIAQTYYDSAKFDMAVRFFERIAKTYRREKWGLMLKPLLSTWYACAQQLGDVELSVRLLVEMLGHGTAENEDPGTLEEDLLAVLKSTVPSSPDETLLVDLSEAQPIFDSNVVFWAPEVKVDEPAAFQLLLTAPRDVTIASLPVVSLAIHFGDGAAPVVVYHDNGTSVTDDGASAVDAVPAPVGGRRPPAAVQKVDLGHIALGTDAGNRQEVRARLRWLPGEAIVCTGTMASAVPATLTISQLVLTMKEGTWTIEIPFDPCGARQGAAQAAKWLSAVAPPRFIPIKREDYSSVVVKHRPHRLLVSISHDSPAYLNEDYPITLNITNSDDRELNVLVDILLQPTEIDYADNSIVLDDERSSGLIKGVACGTLAPGVSVVKTLHLINSGAAGDRMIDISVQSQTTVGPATTSRSASPPTDGTQPDMHLDVSEMLQTLTVPTVDPLRVAFEVGYRRALGARPALADLGTFESEFWDAGEKGEAVVDAKVECVGPWGLYVESMTLLRKDGARARVIDSSMDQLDELDDVFPSEYLPGDEFSDICRIALGSAPDESPDNEPIPGPGEYEIHWRRVNAKGEHGSPSVSRFSLPPLNPPSDGLVALLSVPPAAKLHVPIALRLTIRNQHPTRSANVTVQLEPDPADGFVVAGLRSGRVPILLPGAEEVLRWRLIPIECGFVAVPRIRVMDRRKTIAAAQGAGAPAEVETEGDVVKIVDVRLDYRRAEASAGMRDSLDSARSEVDGSTVGTVLVLP